MNELFNARSLSKNCKEEYTRRFFPNNEVLNFKDYADKQGLKTYSYKDLESEEIWGVPYAVHRNENDDLSVTFQEATHSLIVGTTGVGKSWGHVMDSIYSLSAKKNKPCFFLTDTKGELLENTGEILKKRGYKIYLLNFKDCKHTHMWNPLL